MTLPISTLKGPTEKWAYRESGLIARVGQIEEVNGVNDMRVNENDMSKWSEYA